MSVLEHLREGRVLVSDGATGTMLLGKGVRPGGSPDVLNLSNPGAVAELARQYLAAGADIIHTNTFGASPMKLAGSGMEAEAEEINRRAVHLVRGAVGEAAFISGSCGPSGKLLVPYGDTEPEELARSFEVQMMALIDAGVDMICVETMTDLREAALAIGAAKRVDSGILVMATMTFDETPRGFYTIMGTDIEAAAAGLEEAGADIIGSNCGNGFENMVKIGQAFRQATSRPVIIQSNAGAPDARGGQPVYPDSPEDFAEYATRLIDAGIAIIGGCCGSTPEHIRAIRSVVDGHGKGLPPTGGIGQD